MTRIRRAFVSASVSLALFGLGRFLFNLIGIRLFGAERIGELNVAISTWVLVALIVATVPSVVASKFVSEYLGSGQRARAARILGACLGFTWALCGLASVGLVLFHQHHAALWPLYGLTYASYMVLRSAYFAHQRLRDVVVSELLGFGAFAVLLAFGYVENSVTLASLALIAQPAVYCVKAWIDIRADVEFRGALAEVRNNARGYGVYAGASLANAATGMASYHLAVVLAGVLVPARADIGYFSVLLSTMSPINLVPQALAPVLFADFARRHGASDESGQRWVALRVTVLIQIFALVIVGGLLVFSDQVLRLAGLPASPPLLATWTWLVYAMGLSMVTAPCGHLLNATVHAPKQAVASVAFLVIGIALGCWAMPRFGIVGAAWMRFTVDGGLAWTRLGIAQRVHPWIGRRWTDLVAFHLFFATLFLQTLLTDSQWVGAVTLVVAAACLSVLGRVEVGQLVSGLRWQRG